jgi:hypothetical protein
MLVVPEDDLSINLFADSGRVSAKPVPYRQAASGTDLDWDFIYIRGPFVQSDFDDPSIKESIEKLLRAAKTNTYSVDGITSFSDLLQEDKWRQYELFADIMPQTKLIRSFKSHKISNWLIKKRISGRSRDIHFDVSDLSNDAEPKNYIVQKRLDIKTEYRAFMVRDKLILPLEIKSSKTESTRNKAIGLKKMRPKKS